jgi:hypothetical protein
VQLLLQLVGFTLQFSGVTQNALGRPVIAAGSGQLAGVGGSVSKRPDDLNLHVGLTGLLADRAWRSRERTALILVRSAAKPQKEFAKL